MTATKIPVGGGVRFRLPASPSTGFPSPVRVPPHTGATALWLRVAVALTGPTCKLRCGPVQFSLGDSTSVAAANAAIGLRGRVTRRSSRARSAIGPVTASPEASSRAGSPSGTPLSVNALRLSPAPAAVSGRGASGTCRAVERIHRAGSSRAPVAVDALGCPVPCTPGHPAGEAAAPKLPRCPGSPHQT